MKLAKFLSISLLALSFSNLTQAEEPASYALCKACHQANGQGLPNVFPPLAGSEWVNGPAENLIKIQLRGLSGPIMVNGKAYNSAMPPNATMSDADIAEVLTYIRSTWGNKAPAVTPDMVKALRGEVGKPMLTAADLIDPKKAPKAEPKPEPKPEVKPEPKVEPKPEPKAELKAEPKPEAQPAPEATEEVKLNSGEFKPLTKAASKNSFPDTLSWYVYLFIAICLVPVVISFATKK